eukprot:Hpha_TRINITY_DN14813_c4_g8::TRINITY_DN14813_c4_g8_i1::g.170367::m.170367/K05665/ABCC1; ATP-binding cassette, subfamily C (CFTR/MRP), member 1
MGGDERSSKVAPEPSSDAPPAPEKSYFSRVCVFWLVPTVWRAYWKESLDAEDLPPLPEEFKAVNLGPRAQATWEEVAEERRQGKRHLGLPIIVIVLARMLRTDLILGFVWSLVQGMSPTVMRPILLRNLIKRAASEEHQNDGGEVAAWYMAGLLLTLVAEGIGSAATRVHLADRCGSAMVTTCASLVHQKALRISPEGAGDEKALVGNDVMRCFDCCRILCMFPSTTSSLFGGVVLLFVTLGAPAASGVGLMICVFALSLNFARLCAAVEKLSLDAADKRLRLVTRAVEGIKAVKLSAWEEPFIEQISKARGEEVVFAKKRRTMYMLGTQLGRASPVISAAATVLTVALVYPDSFDAGSVFAAVSIFQALRLAMTMIPAGMTFMATCLVSARRFDEYMLQRDSPGMQVSELQGHACALSGSIVRRQPRADAPKATPTVTVGKEFDAIAERTFCLNVGEVKLPAGGVTAIVGAVGSGKSTLLLGLLGELEVNGTCAVSQTSVGYVPQQAFVASGTLRDNVLMGREFNAELYRAAVRESAMEPDIAMLTDGDQTEVG